MATPTRSVSDVLYGRLRQAGWSPPGASPVSRFADPPAGRPMTKPKTCVLPDVKIFCTGSFGRGRQWTFRDLTQMASNARKLGPDGLALHEVPLVIGHGEAGQQSYLERTDTPAAGWLDPRTVKVVPFKDPVSGRWRSFLVGSFVDVPPAVAAMVKAGRYRFQSAELYDDFKTDEGVSLGAMVRRCSLLGGDPPAAKSLGRLPDPVWRNAERSLRFVRCVQSQPGRSVYTFLEESAVGDRQSLYAAIQSVMPNLSQSFLDDLGDDALAELAKCLPSPDDDTDTAGQQYADDPTQQAAGAMAPAADPTDPQVQKDDMAVTKQYAEKNAKLLAKSGYREPWRYVQMFSEAQKKNPGIAHEMANIHRQAMAGKAAR